MAAQTKLTAHSLTGSRISLADVRAALEVEFPSTPTSLPNLLDALLDDYQLFAIEDATTSSGCWRRVYFYSQSERDKAKYAIALRFGNHGVSTTRVDVPDDRWAERIQTRLRAVRIGNIVVAPPWDVPAPSETAEGECPVIVIRPSMGFGTGHHASTRLCLHALQQNTALIQLEGSCALDLGTGSGVLAIAAAKLGVGMAVGVDHDPDSLTSAHDNIALNNVSDRVSVRLEDVSALSNENAHVVTANLYGSLFHSHAAAILSTVQPGGVLIASGLTTNEEEPIRSVLEPVLRLTSRTSEAEWIALTFTRQE